MTELEDRFSQALHDAVPAPPRNLNATSIRLRAEKRRRATRIAGPSIVVALVAIVAIAVPLSLQGSSTGKSEKSTSDHLTSSSPRGATNRIVADLLDAAPLPPSGQSLSRSPTTELEDPVFKPVSPNLVDAKTWWRAPGTLVSALDYFSSHLPFGIRRSGIQASANASSTARTMVFDAIGPQWTRPTIYTGLQLSVTVIQFKTGVAGRVDAWAIWLPQRSHSDYVPSTVTSVAVVVYRSGRAPTIRRTLGASDARTLASVVNRLPVVAPGSSTCPDGRGFFDSLTFHSSTSDIKVQAMLDGCATVTIMFADGHLLVVRSGQTIDHAVTLLAHLPPGYGH